MKTYIPKLAEIEKKWHVVDVKGQVFGRAVAKVATLLRGKTKPVFTPHLDTGDYVIVLNADKVRLTGKKEKVKTYFHYTGYPRGARFITFDKFRAQKPEELFRQAVWGMLPKNRLGRKILLNLKVYKGDKHPHQSQNPQPLALS
jgi:large subunit ribosomal protein L13